MSLPVAALLLVVGLVLLVRSADGFVAGAEAFALRRRWSPAVIGAVIVGFGTSLPELFTSVIAAFDGQPELAMGNAAGSNVANLLLILGVAALVRPVVGSPHQAPRRDALIATVASVALLVLAAGGAVGAVEGAILVAMLLATVLWQVRSGSGGDGPVDLPLHVPERLIGLRVGGGLVGVLVGAQLLVQGAITVAERVGVSQIVIGSVLVAVGTSLPELATAIASARRGQVEILLGNLLGSNAFNALMVVGASALVGAARGEGGISVDTPAFAVVVAATVVTSAAAIWLSRRPVVTRPVGALLVTLHVASVPALVAIS